MQLFRHQSEFVALSRQRKRLMLAWEMGVGKSLAILGAVAADFREGDGLRTLIVCPKSVMRAAWLRDAEHFHSLNVKLAWSDSKKKRIAAINSGADVLVTNFEQFKMHADDYLKAGVRRLVIDESSKIKACAANGGSSQIAEAAIEFSDKMESVYLLSGTPASNNEVEWFNQIRCIDKTISGLQSYGFANRWCIPKRRKISVRGQLKDVITGWELRPDKRNEFVEMLSKVAWTLRAADCIDLPDETDSVREVELSPAERRAYVTMLNDLRVEAEDRQITVNGSAKLMKLRQITGGAMIGEGSIIRLGKSKLDTLFELVEEIGGKVVVWAEFTHEIDSIVERCNAEQIMAGVIDGRVGAEDRAEVIGMFQNGAIQMLVCHPAAAGHGVTLTAARHDVFYSLGWVPENHEQARKRIHRIGQKWPVEHHYLVAPGTVDEKILDVLRKKKTAAEAIKDLLAAERKLVEV